MNGGHRKRITTPLCLFYYNVTSFIYLFTHTDYPRITPAPRRRDTVHSPQSLCDFRGLKPSPLGTRDSGLEPRFHIADLE